MMRFFRKSCPVLPILYVDANINQIRETELLKKLRSFKYDKAQGLAIVCSI